MAGNKLVNVAGWPSSAGDALSPIMSILMEPLYAALAKIGRHIFYNDRQAGFN